MNTSKTIENEKIDVLGSGYQIVEKHEAREMAIFIEKFLGNPASKKLLSFCTKRCNKCGRRIENILGKYADLDKKLCKSCNVAYLIVSNILDMFITRARVERNDVKESLKNSMWRKGLSSVLEGIVKYGPTKPFTAYVPFLIVWNLTKGCNLACKHCYEDAHVPARDELTSKEALEAVDKMADAGVAYIAISGGEPLTRPDLFDIANHIKERELAFSIATNGTLLTKENVKKLKDANCLYIQISLDGATPETHNSFRGRDSFERTIKGIENAVDSDIKVGVASTVTKLNIHEIPEIIDLTEKLGADIFMYYNFIPTGRGKEIIDLDITPQQRENLLKYLASQVGKRKISLLTTAPQYSRVCAGMDCSISLTHFDTLSQSDRFGTTEFLAEFVGGCGTSRLYCALEPNGDIEPCVFIPIKVGNIKHDDLIDVWQDNEIFKKLRTRGEFKGTCNICRYRNICGGCRARAYGYFGDLQESDPGCIFNLNRWEELQYPT